MIFCTIKFLLLLLLLYVLCLLYNIKGFFSFFLVWAARISVFFYNFVRFCVRVQVLYFTTQNQSEKINCILAFNPCFIVSCDIHLSFFYYSLKFLLHIIQIFQIFISSLKFSNVSLLFYTQIIHLFFTGIQFRAQTNFAL